MNDKWYSLKYYSGLNINISTQKISKPDHILPCSPSDFYRLVL